MTKAAELAKMGEVLTNSQIGGRRNIVINGAMQCSQRSTSETGQHTSGYLTLDRFNFNFVNEDELRTTLTQASEGPDGFANSLKVQATTAESAVAADEEFRVIYKVEAQDLQQLKFGTSAAERITVSFYVRSSVAATYGFNLYQNDANKVNGQAYTINSANTWERKTLTFIGNTSDVINDDTGIGMQLNWFLMAGTDYTSGSNSGWETFATAKHAVGHNANAVATTDNATWQITGIQLEVGSQATPFEHRSYGEELALCQRYYQVVPKYTFFIGAVEVGSNSLRAGIPITRPFRASPAIGNITLTVYDDDDNSFSNAAHAVFANSGSYEVDGTTGYLSIVFNGNLSGRTDNHNVTALYGSDGTLDAEL